MKNTNSPSHEEITRRAQEIWNGQGSPRGQDTAIWLEAERQLTADVPAPPRHRSVETHTDVAASGKDLGATIATKSTAEHFPKVTVAAPQPDAIATAAITQRHEASAPRRPTHKNAPKSAPPESGKPIWAQPHSS